MMSPKLRRTGFRVMSHDVAPAEILCHDRAMVARSVARDGQEIPTFFYGTAWKEDETESCVRTAIDAGFVAIDTANQRKHYYEEGVGRALAGRPLFLQTKFTYRDGQDERLPYDEKAEVEAQIEQSFASSLVHLGVSKIDSYVLHGPSTRRGLADLDRRAWRAMELLHIDGKARHLGVSNVTLEQLELLCAHARVKPMLVQNRCYARFGWDEKVRAFCDRHAIFYQGFSLLTANPEVLEDRRVQRMAKHRSVPVTRVVFRFCLEVGMIVLTGTKSSLHMRDDLLAYDTPPLSEEEREIIARGFVRV